MIFITTGFEIRHVSRLIPPPPIRQEQEAERNGNDRACPAPSERVITRLNRDVDGGWQGLGAMRNIARDHQSGTEFTESSRKAEDVGRAD